MSDTQGKSRLSQIVETIVQEVHPKKVILFGSRAKGTARAESDYDFLVVMRDVHNEREISRRIYRALLAQRTGAAVDIIVVDEKKLAQHKASPFFIYGQALQEGKTFYEQRGI